MNNKIQYEHYTGIEWNAKVLEAANTTEEELMHTIMMLGKSSLSIE